MSESDLSSSSHLTLPGSQPQGLTNGQHSSGSCFSLLLVGQGRALRKCSSPMDAQTVSPLGSSSSTSSASQGDLDRDSQVKSTLDSTIEEDMFTFGEQESKLPIPIGISPTTRVCLYKVEPNFLDNPVRRADLARALPSMHAIVFVYSAEDKHSCSNPAAQYERQWVSFVNRHANRHMLRALVVPPSTAPAPGCNVQVKPIDMGGDVQMHVKNISNSDDVRALSLELLPSIRSRFTETAWNLLSSQLSSASSSLPSTGTRTRKLQSFSEASQVGNNCISLTDVMMQMQAGSDATKLHPQTPLTAYVSLNLTITVIAMVHLLYSMSCRPFVSPRA